MIAQRGLRRFTRKTNVSSERLFAELEQVRAQGYAIADGEVYSDLRALAAPVFDSSGSVRTAALDISRRALF